MSASSKPLTHLSPSLVRAATMPLGVLIVIRDDEVGGEAMGRATETRPRLALVTAQWVLPATPVCPHPIRSPRQ